MCSEMNELFKKIINFGTDGLDKKLDVVKLQIFNISCLLGVVTPVSSTVIYLFIGKVNPVAFVIAFTTSFFFCLLLLLNFYEKYYISSLLASILPLGACLSIFIITGGLVDYEFLILVLAASPYLFFYKKRWYGVAVFILYILCFLIAALVDINPLIEVNPIIIESANNLVYITIAILFLYESTAVYYLHEVAINDLEKREQEMSVAKNRAEESDRLKSAFLANISHEIRTPMNSIIGFSEYLIEKSTTESDKEQYAAIINQSCHQLLNLVNDVLDVSKIETGQVIIKKKTSNLSALLISLYQLFEKEIYSKGISFHLNSEISDEKNSVFIDETKVRQILTNFLSNALKYTEEGEIKLGCRIDENQLHFYVRDTGVGIRSGDLSAIFDRFRQVEENINTGAGLGLAISKGFAESMGGSVCVDSKLGEGSTFYLSLPYEIASIDKLHSQSIVESPKSINLNLSDKCVLIVEDELFNFKLLEVIFKQLNVKVIWAKNGKEAVEIVTQNPDFDMILMDIKMPIMNGLEATKIIKANHPHLPIIAQSAFAFMDERERCLNAGCDDYLTKPIKKQELLNLFQVCVIKKMAKQNVKV